MGQVLEEHPEVSLRSLCELFGVSRSWYYDKPSVEQKAERDTELRDAIERIVLEFPGYGYRRVTEQLRREGRGTNHKRALRVMRQESLLCQLRKRFVVTTDSDHRYRTYPNLLKGMVTDSLNCAWVGDITYIRLPTSFVYLAAILDAYSRKCIGWALSRFIDTRLTLAALRMALSERRPPRVCAPPVYHPLQVPVAGAVIAVDLQEHRGSGHRAVRPADRHAPPVVIHSPPVDHLAHGLAWLPGERGRPSLVIDLHGYRRLRIVESAHTMSVIAV